MSESTSKSEATQLENTTYNILAAVGKDETFCILQSVHTLKTPKMRTDWIW